MDRSFGSTPWVALMSGSDDEEKTHDPTPQKLEDARKRGEIVRSADLNTAIAFGGLLLSFSMFGGEAGRDIGQLSQILLEQADHLGEAILSPGGLSLAGGLIARVLLDLAIIIGVPAGLLILSLFAQRAWIFAPEKLAPKLSRISPISNAGNKFGSDGLFEFAKSTVKLVFISIILGFFLWVKSEEILTSLYASDGQVLAALGKLSTQFLAIVFVLSLSVGAIDYLWQSFTHQRKNRMSRQDLVDENKQSEGDPHMKQQRRRRGFEIAMNQMLADVPTADVIVVNPTHYAVALKWERGTGQVPVCVAKGVDEIARRIREIAAENGVPIFHDPPTARALHGLIEVGDQIQSDHYRAVAAAIRFADLIRKKAQPIR
ncbi:MAG: flagellar biosynthetic protein FlhB [Paracoccaceae bacterium]|jgi:flagellar biosynthetic protein FlhB